VTLSPPPYNTLGRFVAPYKIEEGATVYLRGLKVSEYVDLAHRGFFSNPSDAYTRIQIAQACIDGWEHDIQRIYEDYSPLEIAEELISFEEMIKISQFIVEKLSMLSEDEENKLRGYTRYVHEMSDPKNKKKAESFKCQNCVLYGKHASRKYFCKKFTPEQAEKYKQKLEAERSKKDRENDELLAEMMLNEQEELRKLERVSEAAGKYSTSRRRQNRRAGVAAKRQPYLVINNFKFPECPVSWLDEWIWVSGNMMYHAEKSNIPMFDGGMFDQPHKLYKASRVISSEFAIIDEEERKRKK
jgi:hypothetical protein